MTRPGPCGFRWQIRRRQATRRGRDLVDGQHEFNGAANLRHAHVKQPPRPAFGEMEATRLAGRDTCFAAVAVVTPDPPVTPEFRPNQERRRQLSGRPHLWLSDPHTGSSGTTANVTPPRFLQGSGSRTERRRLHTRPRRPQPTGDDHGDEICRARSSAGRGVHGQGHRGLQRHDDDAAVRARRSPWAVRSASGARPDNCGRVRAARRR
jgi:hypothetical protein